MTIAKDFYIGKYEIIQAQWQAVMGNLTYDIKIEPNNPVTNVSWYDCQDFITKLKEIVQVSFRLPTEAEWEYACRAGTTTAYYWEDGNIDDYAWYSGNNNPYGSKEVGQKTPNAFGLYDMSGNLYEWCHDWFGNYLSNNQTDPEGPLSGSYRVLRGGCWHNNAQICRSAARTNYSPGDRGCDIGFRLLRLYL